MTPDPLFPPLVSVIWTIGLAVTLLVFVPLSVALLHQLWRTARSIQLYAREALAAAGGIAANTAHIPALDETIAVASSTVAAAGDIDQKLAAANRILARRAEGIR